MGQFMREGGFGMWLVLAIAVSSLAVGWARRRGDGSRIAFGGMVAVSALGPLGYSTGMYNVVAYVKKLPPGEQVEVLLVGLREANHNLLFAALLAVALGAAALVLGRTSAAR